MEGEEIRGSKAIYGKYLGYTMKCNGRQQAYIKERVRSGATMLESRGIGKRRFVGFREKVMVIQWIDKVNS